VFTGSSDAGPVTQIYGPVAGVLFVCSAWLTITLINVEDPVRRTVTVVNASGSRAVLAATVLVALATCMLVSGVLLFLPMLLGDHQVTGTDVLIGVLAQFTAASAGVAVGLVSSRLVIPRPGHGLLVALALVALFILAKGLQPVNPMIRLLANNSSSQVLLPATATHAAIAVALLLLSASLTQFIAVRRD
jgi:hypothetical protein